MWAAFPVDILAAYLTAVVLIVVSPGPDNILAISRGLSQGRMAAALSSLGSGAGVLVHAVAAALGLALVLQTSPMAFWVVKAVGGTYLLWLGYRAITAHNLLSFTPAAQQSGLRIFLTALLTNVLNPKVGLFVVAFIPQFVSTARGPVHVQMLVYGALYAAVTVTLFTVLGCFAAPLSQWLARRPKVVVSANVAAGLTFMAAGVSILALGRSR